ncbi:hypothetical protein ABBQ38_012791 [Trebouxia sp. C0009 RCD-2024]
MHQQRTSIHPIPPKRIVLEPRHLIVLACFLATLSAYVERVGFSIAYTAMAKVDNVDEATKGTVLSAFYWGYGVAQVPGGWAAQRWGGQRMLMVSFGLWSTASMLTPGSASSQSAILLARVAVGIAQGFLIPSVHTVLSQWIPPHERAKAVSLSTSGMYLGSAAGMLVLPSIAARAGPGALLKFVGALGFAWLAFWIVVGREVPHRLATIPLASGESKQKGRTPATPWLRMLTQPAVWAIIINNFAFHYAFYVVMNWLPTYFDKVLNANLASLGGVKTLPYLAMFATSNLGGWFGDYLIHQRKVPTATARKLVNTMGFLGAAMALMFMPTARTVTSGVTATTCVLGLAGFARGGFSVNHMDIAPKYAGILMGISNTAGTLAGVIGVSVTGLLLESNAGQDISSGWWQAFAACAVQCVAGSAVFVIAAKGNRLFGNDTDN